MELQVPQVENEPQDVPEDEPQVVPEHEPQILPEDEPQVVPQYEPHLVPEIEPQVVPYENEPPVVPEDEPQVVPQIEPQVVPQNEPLVVPEDEPQVVPVNEAQGFPEYEPHWEDDWDEMCKKGKFKKEGMNMIVMDFLRAHELPIVTETFHKESGYPLGLDPEAFSHVGSWDTKDLILNREFDDAIETLNETMTPAFSYRFGRDCISI